MKATPFSKRDNYEILKIYWQNLKKIFPEPLGQFQANMAQNIMVWEDGLMILILMGHSVLRKGVWFFFINQCCRIIIASFAQMCLLAGTVSQVSDVANRSLVGLCFIHHLSIHLSIWFFIWLSVFTSLSSPKPLGHM